MLQIGRYKLSFEGIQYAVFEELPSFKGVVFLSGNEKFEVLSNLHLGERLLITRTDAVGHIRDLPFNLSTAELLPKCIQVELLS